MAHPYPDRWYWVVVGRIVGDDENTHGCFPWSTQAEASQRYIDVMIADTGLTSDQLCAQRGLDPGSAPVLITALFCSKTEIHSIECL